MKESSQQTSSHVRSEACTYKVLHLITYGYGHYYFYDDPEVFRTFQMIEEEIEGLKRRNQSTELYFKDGRFYQAYQECEKKRYQIKVDNSNEFLRQLDSYFL